MVIGNVYVYITKTVLSTPLGFEIPFFEKDSNIAFGMNICVQALCAFGGILGFVCVELCQSMFNNNVNLLVDVITFGISELSNRLNFEANVTIKAQLRNIFIQIQDFER